jgi:rhamnose utilization protein RhaD (predicted bifunctional aldolase and dehydrogenase)/NAD(P)-dependent dehydrogenase (short-subunit alcohol dehydrogenase family)
MNPAPIRSLWSDDEAARYSGDLGLRVYTSRLLGRDKSLVLHGGGNTSVKVRARNVLGDEEDVIHVKGSGWDLETIEEAGFPPLPLDYVKRLATLPSLSDAQMSNELLTHTLRAGAPAPSVETILHALLPYKYVDHTHADAFIAISNTPDGSARLREVYGDSLVYIPYVMPGFDLARSCAERFPRDRTTQTIGMALEHHGLFSFGDTARESYERMIELVRRAEEYLHRKGAWQISFATGESPARGDRATSDATSSPAPKPVSDTASALTLATLRSELSEVAGFPLLLVSTGDDRGRAFARRADLARVATQGPATPDHSIRTKRVPMVGRDVKAYADEYRRYFEEHARRTGRTLTMLDAAPRVVLDPEFGLLTAGKTATETAIGAEVYAHTIEIISRAEKLGGWTALSAAEIFDVEYWELEQAKLQVKGTKPVFQGEVAVVTGAASGIGKACVASLLKRGATVVGLDLNPTITTTFKRRDYRGIACDLTDEAALKAALAQAVAAFGGIDMLVLNAGIFPPGAPIATLSTESWRRVLGINLDASFVLLREAHPFLKLAPKGGRVAIIGSKNVPAPGPGAASYSASKAALNQLARVAALEWGKDGIRLNTIHPNAVFDTGLWTPEIIAQRAKSYGLSVEAYRTNNVLRTEITSHDVAELAAEMCGPLFAKTTAAQVPVDGGNDRVI